MLQSPSPQREFSFTAQDFERVRRLIYRFAGISLSSAKHDMVYGRLVRRLRALHLSSFDAYLTQLEKGDQHELESFVNALTTNLTSFFREQHHFPILADLVKSRSAGSAITLWCSASSTGEEPYSMAMTMVELFDRFNPPVKIIATDLDTSVLQTAQTGQYSMDKLERLSPSQLKRFFHKTPQDRPDTLTVRPELQAMITFRQQNLIDPTWHIRGPLDAIFCRNVMIYFDKEVQLSILKRFAPLLKPDGLLFVGHSENLYHAADLFQLMGKTVYAVQQKRA